MKPQIRCAFFWKRERADGEACWKFGEWGGRMRIPFRSENLQQHLCRFSRSLRLLPHTRPTKTALFCQEVLAPPPWNLPNPIQHSAQNQEVCSPRRSTAGSESDPIDSRGADPQRAAAVCERLLFPRHTGLNRHRRWQMSSTAVRWEA